ncbi:MAG: site-specific DNA-methyltransferase [Phycisphaerales bacterium]
MAKTAKKLPTGTIAQGDCLKLMASWPEASVDLIFADPPYNIGFKYDHYDDNREHDDYVKWTQDWIDACARLLKPSGSFYILIGDEYAAETRLHLRKLQDNKQLVFRNWIIWHYTFGQNCKLKFNRSHAHLFYCVGSATATIKAHEKITKNPPFTFNRDSISVPSARQTTYNDARANPTGKLPDDVWYLRPQTAEGDYFRPGEDTWYQSRLAGTFKERQGWHPCQLPEALLERIINVSSNPGDLVFDPFTGSGTTLAAAAKLKRDWLGCELSKDYAKRATERIQHVAKTGETMQTTQADKGIERGKPKKKAEPHRSKKDKNGKLVRSGKG